MARRVEGFQKDQATTPPRRYPWHDWMDGSFWEIRQREDYDVPTENMRVNLHERAKGRGIVVRTEIVRDTAGEGLRFQFQTPAIRSLSERNRVPINVGPWTGQPQRTMPF